MTPAGRPTGSATRKESNVITELLGLGFSKDGLGRAIGCSTRTIFDCEKAGVLPSKAEVLEKLQALCEERGVKFP